MSTTKEKLSTENRQRIDAAKRQLAAMQSEIAELGRLRTKQAKYMLQQIDQQRAKLERFDHRRAARFASCGRQPFTPSCIGFNRLIDPEGMTDDQLSAAIAAQPASEPVTSRFVVAFGMPSARKNIDRMRNGWQ